MALVSGASRGIGAEIARQLASDHGFVVFAGARDPDDVEEAEGIIPIELDVTDQGEVEAGTGADRLRSGPSRRADQQRRRLRRSSWGWSDYDLDRAHEVFEVNTFGPWRLSRRSSRCSSAARSRRIVNVSSGAGQLSDMNGGRAAYRLSKAALNALTRTLAWDERGIKVNSMCPGWVRTDMGGPAATRSVEEGADTAVWLATLPDDGPTGGFFRNREPIPW